MIGEIKDGTVETVGDLVLKFDDLCGCTWRIGKTSLARMFERSVTYACVHRAPTHVEYHIEFEIGKMYKKRGDDKKVYSCLRICNIENVVWFFEKGSDKIFCVEQSNEYYLIGNTQKSFGCEAVLTIRKVVTGMNVIVIDVEWRHNHDLKSFASTSRRDPSAYVKEWFASAYAKGLPPMKALRGYVNELFTQTKVNIGDVVQIVGDR